MPEVTPKLAKQHPVPQHITAFEFKLVGDLTLKQFIYAATGLAVAYAAFISNLTFILKWLTILVAATLGLGSAFVPIQDRTLDQWLLNFIRAVFSPTQRVWKKQPLPPEFLREDYSQFLTSQVLSMTPPQSRAQLAAYLKTKTETPLELIADEQEFLEGLNFKAPLPKGITVQETEKKKEEYQPQKKPFIKNITPGRKIRVPTIEGTITFPHSRPPRPKVVARPKKAPRPPEATLLKRVIREFEPRGDAGATGIRDHAPEAAAISAAVREVQGSKASQDHAPEAAAISAAVRPNIIRGVVRDSQNRFLKDAVVLVKDQDGDPVRALKTNALGQFFSTTPIDNGDYAMEISADGRNFDIIKFTAEGKVLEPFEFRERYAGS
jgi:hypothetical protein